MSCLGAAFDCPEMLAAVAVAEAAAQAAAHSLPVTSTPTRFIFKFEQWVWIGVWPRGRHLLTAPLAALMIHSGATGAAKET